MTPPRSYGALAHPVVPDLDEPTLRLARTLNAEIGNVITWAGGILWRWDGRSWQKLKAGDWCLYLRTGMVVFYNGAEFVHPRVTDGQVNDLARVMDPWAEGDDEEKVRKMARRALAWGYTHRMFPADDPETVT